MPVTHERLTYEQLAVTIEAFVREYGLAVSKRGDIYICPDGTYKFEGWTCTDQKSDVQMNVEGTAERVGDAIRLTLLVDHCRRCAN
jgi:hypothetical protein